MASRPLRELFFPICAFLRGSAANFSFSALSAISALTQSAIIRVDPR
jgi:hypothetical protein